MNNIKNITDFYLRPVIVIQFLLLLFYLAFGSYFEEYEGYISSAVEGIYTIPASRGWDSDTHFLLLYVYNWLSGFTDSLNAYGIVLFLNTWLSLTLAGAVLYRILRINLASNSWILFVLLSALVIADNLLNLNSTRIAFLYIISIFGFIESWRFQGKSISRTEWFLLSILIIYASLIRFESVLLFSVFYLVLLVIHRRLYRMVLLPVIISASIYVTYNIISLNLSSEEKKVFIYKERSIFDRFDIDYMHLSPSQKMEVDALMMYCITDKEHFQVSFYDAVSLKTAGNDIRNKLFSFYQSYHNAWRTSIYHARPALPYAFFFLVSVLLLIVFVRAHRDRWILHNTFLFLVPVILCFYTIVPLRFLVPFFALSGCVNVILLMKKNSGLKFITGFCAVAVGLAAFYQFETSMEIRQSEKDYRAFAKKLDAVVEQNKSTQPVVINSLFPVNYFPLSPFDNAANSGAVFLNYYLLSADDYYIKTWKELCNCNTFSLKERVDYMVRNKNVFLVDTKAFRFLQTYFESKYNIRLVMDAPAKFDNHLVQCRLRYAAVQ